MPFQHWLYTIPLRVRSLFRRSRVEQDLDEELQYHVDQQAAAFIAQGMAPEDARARAMRALGGLEQRKEECRDTRGISLVEHVLRDAMYALRTLRRDAGFTLGALTILALGIGASGAVYAVTSTVLVAPLPFRDPDRLVIVREVMPSVSDRAMSVNPLHFREWQQKCACFEDVALLFGMMANLSGASGSPERVLLGSVTPNLFPLLGVGAQAGRTFHADDAAAGNISPILISDGLWRRRFGADSAIVGQSLDVNGIPRTIVGVLPRTFRYYFAPGATPERPVDVYQPWAVTPEPWWRWAGNYSYDAVARLRDGVSRNGALAELDVLQESISQRFERRRGQELRAELVPLHEWVTGESRTSLLLLIAAVAMAFVVGCVNIANLMLTRGTARAREAAVRAAVGASRMAIFRTVLIESVVLALAGTAAGAGLAMVFVKAFIAAAPPDLPRLSEIQMDWTALSVGAGLFVVATLAFGVLPAARLAGAEPQDALRTGGRSASDVSGRLRQALVSIEVALSVALLVAAGLLLTSFMRINGVDRGFDPNRALTADFNLPAVQYRDPAARLRFYDALIDRLESSSIVEAAGVTSSLPLRGLQWVASAVAEGDSRPIEEAMRVQYRWVSSGYFQAMGLPLRAGRSFLPEDRGKPAVVLSEGAARRLWPQGEAIGRRFSRGDGRPLSEVVGVVPDVHSESLEGDPGPIVYAQMWEPMGVPPSSVVLRTRGDSSAAIGVLREAVASLDRQMPLANVQTMRQLERTVLGGRRFQLILIASFAVASLLLAAVGTYSVLAYAVSRRAREIAIRLALGSSPAVVRGMILRQGLRPVMLGLVLGLLAALLSGRLVAGLLFGVEPTDPVTILAVTAVMLAAATLACWIPARRVVQTSPLNVLRYE
jgi:predicted permease